MKKQVLGVAALTAPILAMAGSPTSSSIEISFVGQFRGAGPFPDTGTTWFALSARDGRFELIQTQVQVQRVPDSCSDFATRVIATEAQDPLLMVRGSQLFKSGPVDSVFHGNRYLLPGENVQFKLKNGAWFSLEAYGSAMPDSAVTNYQVRLVQGPLKQVIAAFPVIDTDGPPKLLWAGDLDRDEKPDVLFDLTTSYAGRLYVLFLSSTAAGDDQLVREVGRFRVTGC